MENNVGYALGLVEGFLENLQADGNPGAEVALEQFHVVEAAYLEATTKLQKKQATLDDIQMNLNGWTKS